MRTALINATLVFSSLLVAFVALEAATRVTQRASLWRYPSNR